MIQQT
jgi:hypothetical protein